MACRMPDVIRSAALVVVVVGCWLFLRPPSVVSSVVALAPQQSTCCTAVISMRQLSICSPDFFLRGHYTAPHYTTLQHHGGRQTMHFETGPALTAC